MERPQQQGGSPPQHLPSTHDVRCTVIRSSSSSREAHRGATERVKRTHPVLVTVAVTVLARGGDSSGDSDNDAPW